MRCYLKVNKANVLALIGWREEESQCQVRSKEVIQFHFQYLNSIPTVKSIQFHFHYMVNSNLALAFIPTKQAITSEQTNW